MKRRQPRAIGALLAPFAASLAPPTLLAEIQQAWPATVGEALVREALPTSERAGVVTVSCRSATWAQELDLLSRDVVARLNAALGRPAVTALRCVATPAPSARANRHT